MTSLRKNGRPSCIRWLVKRDLPEVVKIESDSFEFPWSEEDFACHLRKRNCIGVVIAQGDVILGFLVYDIWKYHIEIVNIAVCASRRGIGIGGQMIANLIGKLSPQRRTRIVLEISERNLLGQQFFRSCGFRSTSILRGQYEDPSEDSYVMEYWLSGQRSTCLSNLIDQANHI